MSRPTDPQVIETIQAELALSVYKAKHLARLRLMGTEPAPSPNPVALRLWRMGSLLDKPRLTVVDELDSA